MEMMKTNKSATLLSLLALLAFSHLAVVSCRKIITSHGVNDGFTLDLIHRDSPLSPFYNPSITTSQRLRNTVHRSFSRASQLKRERVYYQAQTPNHDIQSDIIPIPGEYLMKFSIGTPPVETVAIADTGSDLTWIQCKPCADCFQQKAPLFDSRKSSTYKTVGCDTKTCKAVESRGCVRKHVCEYEMNYGDQSYSTGDVASETFTFGITTSKRVDKVSIPNVIFGCGHDNGGTFSNATSGIVGLGGSNISIIKQLDKHVNGKFSYCLIPSDLLSNSSSSNATSRISFGSEAVVSGPNVVTTPIIQKNPKTYYYLNLEGVSVGKKKLAFKSSKLSSFAADGDLGNIIIDSGTTLTLLPSDFYESLESTLVHSIKGKRIEDPTGTFSLCYESKNGVIDAPKVVFHFTDADVELLPASTFAEIDKGLACLTIVPIDDLAIFGNLAQMNFLIGYDLLHNKLSFLPTDCTKHGRV